MRQILSDYSTRLLICQPSIKEQCMNLTIREASLGDAKIIIDFQIKMAWETEKLNLDRAVVEKGVISVFNDPNKGTYFVAEDEGKIVASLLITFEWSDWRNSTVWWIQSVFVIEESRGKGVFKKMYQFLSDKVKRIPSLAGLRLYVDKTNTSAQGVYSKLGMNGDHYQLYEWLK